MRTSNSVRAYRTERGRLLIYGRSRAVHRARVVLTNFTNQTTGEQLAELLIGLRDRCQAALSLELVLVDTDYQIARLVAQTLNREVAIADDD